MIYPTILTVVAIGVVAALLATVVPTVVDQFAHMGQELPGMTLALIAMSDFVQDYGLHVLIAILISPGRTTTTADPPNVTPGP